jgi:uncharacterized protein YrzB (UPF0473 family)
MSNKDFEEIDEEALITIITDDDEEIECVIITILEIEDYGDYIALMPASSIEDEEEGELYLYRYSEDEDEMPVLGNIESDEEFEAVSTAFEDFLKNADEYDEILSDEDYDRFLNGEE